MKNALKWIEPTEKEIENAILTYLNYQVGCLAFKVNTMGVYDQRGGFYRKLSRFVLPGTPDILASLSVRGLPIFIGFEVKAPTGRQSKQQKEFQEKLESRSDGFYFIVRTVKDVEDALTKVRDTVQLVASGLSKTDKSNCPPLEG